jgi:Uma2 family endonuclease
MDASLSAASSTITSTTKAKKQQAERYAVFWRALTSWRVVMNVALNRQLLIPHRFSVAEWHQMIVAGVIGEDDRVELLDGLVVNMTPQTPEGMEPIAELTWLLARALPEGYRVRAQGPLTIQPDSEPEPDLAVVPESRRGGRASHPTTAPLVIEVARSSLAVDRTIKLRLYARAGVQEFWIVDTAKRTVEVYRGPLPKSGRYRTMQVYRAPQTLVCSSLPGISITVAAIFR